MIIKLPKQDDPFKDDIEKIAKVSKNSDLKGITQNEKNKQLKNIKEKIPQLENDIKDLIKSLKSKITSCDAQQLLDYFGIKYSFSTPSTVEEDMDSTRNFILDYLHSIITAIGVNNDIECSEESLTSIEEILEKIKMQSLFYLMFTSDYKGEANEIKFLQSAHNMIVRGDSYSSHKIEMCRELFSKCDDVLKSKYNLSANKLIDGLIKIVESSINNLDIQRKYFDEMIIAHQEFVKKLDEISGDEEKFEFIQKYRELEEGKNTNKKLQEIYDKTGISFNDSVFKIHNFDLPKELLDSLSLAMGDNNLLREGKMEYFPANDTQIYDKPLIKIVDDYFSFNPASLYYNMHTLLENIVLDIIPPKKHQKNYYKKKGEYLEDASLGLFKKLLPASTIHKNLKYGVDDEVDGIVIYDNHIFIIEAKSNKFTLGARKGNVDKIKRNTKDIVEKAYQQAIRAKKYILSNDLVEFRDKNEKTILTIEKNKINGIYLVNTTLEPLNHISTNLSSLKEFGFIQDDEWIWSIYLNDLRIIAEIIDSPSEFLVYIERRIKFNDYSQIRMAEEIDIFGYFLSDGLYFDDIDFPENGFILNIDSSFSKDIDLYYHWKEGVLDIECQKPTYASKCKDNIKFLIEKINKIEKENFSVLSKFLLEFDCHTQKLIKEQIDLILKSQRTDFHLYIDTKDIGVVFVNKEIYNFNKLKKQCKLYAYERKIHNWFVVIIGNAFVDFEKFYYENRFDKMIEEEVEGLKRYRLQQTIDVQKKIGRNETCPCGSGKKYKKCCLTKSVT